MIKAKVAILEFKLSDCLPSHVSFKVSEDELRDQIMFQQKLASMSNGTLHNEMYIMSEKDKALMEERKKIRDKK